MVYTKSGVNENNCIFREDSSGAILFSSPVTTMWITTLHDPENSRVQFVLVSGEMAVIKLYIELKDLGNGISSTHWQFTFTSLTEESIDETTEGKLLKILTFLAKALKHYCETGDILRMNNS